MKHSILKTIASADYQLLDSGNGMKLERFGSVVLSRPDPQALWSPLLPATEWQNADAEFSNGDGKTGSWKKNPNSSAFENMTDNSEMWRIFVEDISFGLKLSPFKHTGIFPEQIPNWQWMKQTISDEIKNGGLEQRKNEQTPEGEKGEISIINFFGYTGGATLACAQVGAKVCHVDSSKTAIAWARTNAEASGLSEKPVRWIEEDAKKFIERELKRGKRYDGIIMDPPSFGHGAKGELWKIEDDFVAFVESCMKLLSKKPLFFLINGYSAGYSSTTYANNLQELLEKHGGSIEHGELTIEESSHFAKEIPEGEKKRLLPAGIFARWSAK